MRNSIKKAGFLLALCLALPVSIACHKEPAVVHVTEVTLDQESLTLAIGQTAQLTATVLPKDADDKYIVWSSGNKSIATVTDGTVTAVAEGTCDITVKALDGNITATCKVTVTKEARKAVRPSGTGWTKTKADEGLILYTFSGTDPVSGKPQYVVVADVDTSLYKLNFFYDGSSHITSGILSSTGAVLAMNGAYETTSIYIKVDGSVKKKDLADTIGSTTVPNWKNDGGIAVDKSGNISFLNTIFRDADSKGTGSYGEKITEQRTYYRGQMGGYYSVFSSAPLLIWDYDAIGTKFLPQDWSETYLQQFDYENPYRHQGWTHPRTVMAMDCDGHLLMVVADGRYTGKAVGFSAKNLTTFLVNNFDPRFALNMDGGGSTDMCVAGQGDSKTHVVNHPCDSGSWDAPGERTLSSFFYLMKK